jgi:hypothetical protein
MKNHNFIISGLKNAFAVFGYSRESVRMKIFSNDSKIKMKHKIETRVKGV